MTDKEKIADLERRLAEYEMNPAAKFYKSFTKAFDEISEQIEDKTLNVDAKFTKSILKLAEKSEIIFRGMKEGLSLFKEQQTVDEKRLAKVSKSQSVAL